MPKFLPVVFTVRFRLKLHHVERFPDDYRWVYLFRDISLLDSYCGPDVQSIAANVLMRHMMTRGCGITTAHLCGDEFIY